MGANFDRYEDGFSFTKEAAHSKRRILHAGDRTGLEIEKTLGRDLLGQKNRSFFPYTTVIQLLIEGKVHNNKMFDFLTILSEIGDSSD